MRLTRLAVGVVLAFTSALIPAAAREHTLQEQAKKIHQGSKVIVQMKNQNTVIGRLVEVTQTNFTLELPGTGGLRRNLLFQDVSSIRQIKEGPTFVETIATIPLMLICGIEWIFNKNACGDL